MIDGLKTIIENEINGKYDQKRDGKTSNFILMPNLSKYHTSCPKD